MKDTIVRRKNRNVRTRFCEHLSKIVHPLLPWTKTTRDRSILLATHFEERGILLLCLSPLRSTTERGSKKVCFKGSTLILFQLQKSACESKKSVFEDESARREFSRPLKSTSVHRSLKSSVPSFFPSFLFFYYYYYSIYVFRVFEYSYRIFDGTETLGRSSFIFTRGKIEYFFQFSNFFRNNEFLSKRFGFFSSPRASTCFEAKIKFNIKLFHLSLRPSNLKWFSLKNK